MRVFALINSSVMDQRTNGLMDQRTNKTTNGRMDKASYEIACPQLKQLLPCHVSIGCVKAQKDSQGKRNVKYEKNVRKSRMKRRRRRVKAP